MILHWLKSVTVLSFLGNIGECWYGTLQKHSLFMLALTACIPTAVSEASMEVQPLELSPTPELGVSHKTSHFETYSIYPHEDRG